MKFIELELFSMVSIEYEMRTGYEVGYFTKKINPSHVVSIGEHNKSYPSVSRRNPLVQIKTYIELSTGSVYYSTLTEDEMLEKLYPEYGEMGPLWPK